MKKAISSFVLLIMIKTAYCQNIGIGNTDPQARLDISGDLALRSADITITSTYNYALDVNTVKQSFYKLKQPLLPAGNFILNGITSSANGRTISILNSTNSSMEIYNEDLTETTQNRITTGTGTTMAVYSNGSIMLRYDTAVMRWVVLAAHNYNLNYFGGSPSWSLSGNTGTTSADFIGTTDQQPLRFRVNGGSAGIIDSALGNISLGVGALRNNVTGFNNTVIGKNALKSNIDYAQNNVAIGTGALENNMYAEGHIAIGYQALQNYVNNSFPGGTYGANHNTAVGYKTLRNNSGSALSNTAVGGFALTDNTSGLNNTAVGDFSMWKNTTGSNSVAMGAQTLYNNVQGYNNTAIGSQSLYSNVGGYGNTAVGFLALRNVTYSENNTAIGANTLVSGGYRCTAVGAGALYTNQSFDNVAIGMNSLVYNTTGHENTSLGTFSLNANIGGNNNVALGFTSLSMNTSGINNTAAGDHSLNGNTNGMNNTALGYNALLTNTTGKWNTVIGDNSNTSVNNLNGATALGSSAVSNADNKIVIGANVGGMVIGGYSAWTNLSDGRFKKNIRNDVPGLDFIKQLRPVTYTIDIDKLQHHITAQMPDSIARNYYPKTKDINKANTEIKTGFIAQEVEALAKKLGYQFDGVNAPKNSTDNYSIAYSQFVVPLVKAVQEQQAMIEKLQKQNELLRLQNEAILERLNKSPTK